MNTGINLEAYFDRIGYNGPKDTSIKTLIRLHELHPQSIPFENLNPFLGMPVHLGMEPLQNKILYSGRGGYCFEHNLLFQQVLARLGFSVRGLGARVIYNQPVGKITSRGHMLLLVEISGENWIADVGFGGLGPTAPLRLVTGLIQETPHETYRLIRSRQSPDQNTATGDEAAIDDDSGESDYILQSEIKGEWKNLYKFGLESQYLPDYELANWYLSNHPESHFVTGLFVARSAPGLRHALRNNEYSLHHTYGETEKRTLGSVAEMKSILEEVFLISLPDNPGLDEKLEKLLKPAEKANA